MQFRDKKRQFAANWSLRNSANELQNKQLIQIDVLNWSIMIV